MKVISLSDGVKVISLSDGVKVISLSVGLYKDALSDGLCSGTVNCLSFSQEYFLRWFLTVE